MSALGMSSDTLGRLGLRKLFRLRRSFLGACLQASSDKKNTNWQEIALGELGRGRNGCGEKSVVQFLFFQTSICVLSLQLRSPGFRVGILAIFLGNNYVMLGVRICPCSQLTCDQASLYFRGGKAKKKSGRLVAG